MKEADFIRKEDQSPFHKDFKALQEEAIKGIQKLAGDLWTDYNIHDPGVTILENLVFAITDLCYKLGFDVQDYLVDEDGRLDNDHQGLYTPEKILTTNPVTIQDFRKVLFDQVKEIENVWIEPVPAGKGEVEGLYNMYVFLDPSSWNQGRLHSAELKNKVEKDILRHWPGIRSFGEDLHSITFLEPQYIFLRGELIFKNTDSLEETLAEIVYKMDNYFSPSVGRQTLDDLIEANERLEDIYDGPLLETGFISHLPPRPKEVSRARVLAILSNIPDIERVERLRLIEGEHVNGKWEEKETTEDGPLNIDRIKVKEGFIPRFRFEKDTKGDINDQPVIRSSGADWIMTLKLRKKSSSKYLPVSFDKMIHSLRKMQALRNRSYSIEDTKSTKHQQPVGQYREFGRYFSIREVFPYIYGINRFGLSRNEKRLRKAQVKQLKGYLLLFEQLLANTTSQIQNLKHIYSTSDDHADHFYYPKTFSSEEMEDIEMLYDLDMQSTVDAGELDADTVVLNLAFEGYKGKLSDKDKNRPVNELLEEFGEKFFTDPIDFCEYFELGLTLSDFDTIDASTHLDQFLKSTALDPRVAEKAFRDLEDYLVGESKKNPDNLPALNEDVAQDKVDPGKVLKSLMDRLSQHLPHLPHKSKVLDYMLALYGEQFRQKTLRRIGGPHQIKSEEREIIRNKLRMLRKLPDFSANLSKAPSYPASREPSEMNGFELKVQVLLGLIENDLDGSEGRSLFSVFDPMSFVSNLGLRREPYHAIEQRSRLKTEQINALVEKRLIPPLTDFEEPGDHSMLTDEVKKSIKFFKHDYISESFLKNGTDPDAYFIYPITKRRVTEDRDGELAKYYSHVWKQEGSAEETRTFHLLLRTRFFDRIEWFDLGTLDSLELAVNMGWYLIDICGDFNRATERFTLIDHIKLRPEKGEEDIDFREFFKDNQQISIAKDFNFYNFTASIILPNWNRRFGDRAFQQLADETILLNLPAHILGHVHWLDVERYQEYEKYYQAWISDVLSVENRRLEAMDAGAEHNRLKQKQLEKAQGELHQSRKAFVLFLLKLQQDRFHENT